jgi:hypothetical protein
VVHEVYNVAIDGTVTQMLEQTVKSGAGSLLCNRIMDELEQRLLEKKPGSVGES